MGTVELTVERMRHFTVSAPFARLLELERSATRVLQIQPTHVPGLLQTREYATAVAAQALGKPAGDPAVQEVVALRLARSEAFLRRLDSDTPPTLAVALNESALTATGVDAAVQSAQIAHLREIVSRCPTVRLAVTSLSAAGFTEARVCEVFETDGEITATFFEAAAGDDLTTDPETGRGYRDLVLSLLTD